MNGISLKREQINEKQLGKALREWVLQLPVKPMKALLLPPDYARTSGWSIVQIYTKCSHRLCCDIMPALGTHIPMACELSRMFGNDLLTGFCMTEEGCLKSVRYRQILSDMS